MSVERAFDDFVGGEVGQDLELGTQPANHYLPRRRTDLAVHEEDLTAYCRIRLHSAEGEYMRLDAVIHVGHANPVQAVEDELPFVAEVALQQLEARVVLNRLEVIGTDVVDAVHRARLQLKQALSARQAWDAAVEALAATGIPEPARRAPCRSRVAWRGSSGPASSPA